MKAKFTVLVEDYNVPLHPWIFWNEIFGPINYELTGRGIYVDNLYVFERDQVTWGPVKEHFVGSGNYFERQMSTDKGFVAQIVNHQLASFRAINKFADKVLSTDFKHLSNKQLFSWYQEFRNVWLECGRLAAIPPYMDMSDDRLSDRVKDAMKKILKSGEKTEMIFSKLTTPLQETYMYKEQLAVLKILVTWKNNPSSYKALNSSQSFSDLPAKMKTTIKDLVKNFGWMQFYYDGQAASPDYYYDLLKRQKRQPERLLASKIADKKALKDYQSRLAAKLNPELQRQMAALRDFSYIKELRKEVQIYRLNYAMQKWWLEAARRLFTTATLAKYLFPAEIKDWLMSGKVPDVSELHRRYESLTVVYVNGQEKFYSGPKALKYKEMFFSQEIKISENQQLKGATAYPGKVKGVVKIVNSLADLDKFKEGDILVSFSTNPSLVPAMNKAAAIITNTGGVTCHAAIVARELKTPCIIGTKIATKVLKDGDLVEVDADKGVVRIIKRLGN